MSQRATPKASPKANDSTKKFEKLAMDVMSAEAALRECWEAACESQVKAGMAAIQRAVKPHALALFRAGFAKPKKTAKEMVALKTALRREMENAMKLQVVTVMQRCAMASCGKQIAKYIAKMAAFFDFVDGDDLEKCQVTKKMSDIIATNDFADDEVVRSYGVLNLKAWYMYIDAIEKIDRQQAS